jgi:protein TonB
MGKPIEPDNPCSVESGYASAMMRYSTAALMQSSGPALAGGSLAGAPGSAPATSVGGSRVKVDISSAVAAGNLLYQVAPIYPPIAKAARVQGTVVLRGIISTTGEISELSVVGGPPMLISAAMDAVKQWRYSPYRVNGQPVEVETTVNVVFSLDLPATAAPTGPKP